MSFDNTKESMVILSLLKSYWKPLGIILISAIALGGAYYKGYTKCQETSIKKELNEYHDRVSDYIEVRDENDRIIRDIDNHRRINPKDDRRDSCLLSNNPLEASCLE